MKFLKHNNFKNIIESGGGMLGNVFKGITSLINNIFKITHDRQMYNIDTQIQLIEKINTKVDKTFLTILHYVRQGNNTDDHYKTSKWYDITMQQFDELLDSYKTTDLNRIDKDIVRSFDRIIIVMEQTIRTRINYTNDYLGYGTTEEVDTKGLSIVVEELAISFSETIQEEKANVEKRTRKILRTN